jgi:hypothetical protein
MGSPHGADFTTRTEAPGTIPISIRRTAMLPVPITETTRAGIPLGMVSSVTSYSPLLKTDFKIRNELSNS